MTKRNSDLRMMRRVRSTIMANFRFISMLAIALELSFSTALHAQNPPMNCTPDGIIEVCTLADTTSTPVAAEAVAPPSIPAPPVPHVTYKDGQLTITAENVPLNDVLREVSRVTGATLEVPAGSAREPVFTNIGPGSVRDVLVKLLNGTQFNYVMTGSQDTSSDLKKIVLTPAGQSTEDTSPPVVAESVAPQPAMAQAETREQRRAEFTAKFESVRAALMQRAQEKYAEHVAQGDFRTPDPNASAAPAAPVSPAASPAPPSPATDSPAPDTPAPDSANQ